MLTSHVRMEVTALPPEQSVNVAAQYATTAISARVSSFIFLRETFLYSSLLSILVSTYMLARGCFSVVNWSVYIVFLILTILF